MTCDRRGDSPLQGRRAPLVPAPPEEAQEGGLRGGEEEGPGRFFCFDILLLDGDRPHGAAAGEEGVSCWDLMKGTGSARPR